MTMIGAINCLDGVVVLADAQETITDYAKWSVDKVKFAELNQAFRVVMVGAGDGSTIDMIWEYVSKWWGGKGGHYFQGFVAGVPHLSIQEWREKIVDLVRKTVAETVVPWGRSHPGIELVWMIQDISQPTNLLIPQFELFKTVGLNEETIRGWHFGGNPILLARFLAEQYLRFHNSTNEARALAAYMLWECKENDPTVGKRSDIVVFNRDGTWSQVGHEELTYWEDHFKVLKREIAVLPLLSCATGIAHQLYDPGERMERLNLVIKNLTAEQSKIRQGKRKPGRIDDALSPQVRRLTEQQAKRKVKRLGLTPSTPETSEDRR